MSKPSQLARVILGANCGRCFVGSAPLSSTRCRGLKKWSVLGEECECQVPSLLFCQPGVVQGGRSAKEIHRTVVRAALSKGQLSSS